MCISKRITKTSISSNLVRSTITHCFIKLKNRCTNINTNYNKIFSVDHRVIHLYGPLRAYKPAPVKNPRCICVLVKYSTL